MRRGEPLLRIRLLGPLEVEVSGRPIVVDTRKALAIIALVAAEGRPFARDELAAMFWPDADDEAPAAPFGEPSRRCARRSATRD